MHRLPPIAPSRGCLDRAASSRVRWPRRVKRYGWALPLMVCLDQAAKAAAVGALGQGRVVDLVPDVLALAYAENHGAVLSSFVGSSLGPMLPLLSVACVLLLCTLFHRADGARPWTVLGVGAVLSGASANLIDRIVRGHVVDFVEFSLGTAGPGAVFNLADIFITCGLALVFFDSYVKRARPPFLRPPTPARLQEVP